MKRILNALALAMLVASPVSAQVFDPSDDDDNSGVVAYSQASNDAEAAMFALVDAAHEDACGKGYGIRAAPINNLARWRSKYMYEHDDLDHDIPPNGGSGNWADYFDQYGVEDENGSGENIGVNNFPANQTVQTMFNGWMNSDGHRAVIEWCDLNVIGIGVYIDTAPSLDKYWYTMIAAHVNREEVEENDVAVRSCASSSCASLFRADSGQKTFQFRHRTDSAGNIWDYVKVKGESGPQYGWIRNDKTTTPLSP